MSISKIEHTGLKAQEKYVEKLEQRGFKFGLTVGDAFVRGIRDIGYRHSGTALDELMDNSIQAEAENIHVVLGYTGKSKAKPTAVAVVDDGHGMVPDMIRLSAIWGGTHRENDRKGMGRYGYGLPSACVSQGQRFTIFSKTEKSAWHKVALDLEAIKEGKLTGSDGEIVVPEAVAEEPPKWLQEHVSDMTRGTVVVIDKLDRLSWKTSSTLTRELLQHIGVTYRNYLRQINIWVDGTQVEAIDPLFTTPGFRFFDEDEDRAEAMDPISISVKDPETRKPVGEITVRFAYFPASFASKDKRNKATSRNRNPRFQIMKDHRGVIFTRMGRQIDVVDSHCPWMTFSTNDNYWGCEVDFPAVLDEEFSITTSKQRVVVSKRIWELLKEHGAEKTISRMRQKYRSQSGEAAARQEEKGGKRASETAMEDSEKIIRQRVPETETRRKKGEEKLREEAVRKARETGRPVADVEEELVLELKDARYRVRPENRPGSPFFRVEQLGGTKVLYLNSAHPFYAHVYMGKDSGPAVRAALETVLFVVGDCALDATEDRNKFYEVEIAEWSTRLSVVLDQLNRNIAFLDDDGEEETEAVA